MDDHMNAHLHRDGSIGYEDPCDEKLPVGALDAEDERLLRDVYHEITSAHGVKAFHALEARFRRLAGRGVPVNEDAGDRDIQNELARLEIFLNTAVEKQQTVAGQLQLALKVYSTLLSLSGRGVPPSSGNE